MSGASHTAKLHRLYAPPEPRREPSFAKLKPITDGHPCDGCRHIERCKAGLACEAFALFTATGRNSPIAARQPSTAIYERIQVRPPPERSAAERQRAKETLAVSLKSWRY